MKKSLWWVLIVTLMVSMVMTFSLAGCKGAAEEPAAEEVAEGPFTIAMVVKSIGNPFFEKCKEGGESVASEFGDTLIYQGPETATAEGQITLIDALIAQAVDGIAISANDSTALVPKCQEAMNAGIKVISFDSGIDPDGRILHVNQADPELIGRGQVQMIAEMIDYEGQIAILSATSQATNQNLWIEWMEEELKKPGYENMELVAVVYGDDEREKSYNEAIGLFASYPDLKGIISPTTVGVAATARALEDQGLNGQIQLTGLGLPSEMAEYILNGTCQKMALWNPIDLGNMATYVTRALITGEITGEVGETLDVPGFGEREIIDSGNGPEILMGPPFVFDASNIEEWAQVY
jgi:rhamnose transport system substrate-binding protein